MSKTFRGNSEREADKLVVGEKVWLVDGIYTSEAEVVEVPGEYFTYRVRWGRGGVPTREFRSDLFRRPAELSELVDRLQADHEALTDTVKEFEEALGEAEDRLREVAAEEESGQ